MTRLQVTTPSRRYDVVVARGALDTLASELLGFAGQVVVCSDGNVAPLYLERVSAGLREAGFAASHVVIPAGEEQ